MMESRHSIFRPEAIQRHEQGTAQPDSPHRGLPRAIPFLWALLGVLVASGLVFWFTLASQHVFGE